MRIVFVGAGNLTSMTARELIAQGQDVVIIEQSKEKIEELSDELDCGFLHGDGSRPDMLREVDPQETDVLLCVTGDDRINIIASLIGRSLGFKRVITKIENPELAHICTELGLDDTIIPTRTISRFLIDFVSGRNLFELSSMIRGDARFFTFVAREEEEGEIRSLQLPGEARVICLYRGRDMIIARSSTEVRKGDEVIVLTRSGSLGELQDKWAPKADRKGAGAKGPLSG